MGAAKSCSAASNAMAIDPLLSKMRPGFPKESLDEKSYRTTIEYVGVVTNLLLNSPTISTQWGNYPGLVTEQNLERFEGNLYGILTITCERKFDTSENKTGTKLANETSYEIDWVDVQRSLFEHPKFRLGAGGEFELTAVDVEAIRKWMVQPNPVYKAIFVYDKAVEGDHQGTLSAHAKTFARGNQLGIEYWIDKAPVARRSDTWVKGPPPAGSAGQKQTPPGFPNLPSGYQWIRSTDRALRAGGQSSWTNDTEWIGANEVLIDVDEIFWTAPT